MPAWTLHALLFAGAAGCFIYAFIPPGHPEWVGAAGALLGGDFLARARTADDD